MKLINNSQLNSILFVKSNEVTSDITSLVLRQLGSSRETIIDCELTEEDCSTALVQSYLGENQFANGIYILNVVDSLSEVIFTSTVRIENNTDMTRAYLVMDDDVSILDTIPIPAPVISWATGTITFSNDYDG